MNVRYDWRLRSTWKPGPYRPRSRPAPALRPYRDRLRLPGTMGRIDRYRLRLITLGAVHMRDMMIKVRAIRSNRNKRPRK